MLVCEQCGYEYCECHDHYESQWDDAENPDYWDDPADEFEYDPRECICGSFVDDLGNCPTCDRPV